MNREKKVIKGFNKTPDNSNLLKKLKVPLRDYQRMFKKTELEHNSSIMRGDDKAKSLFTLTSGKRNDSGWED